MSPGAAAGVAATRRSHRGGPGHGQGAATNPPVAKGRRHATNQKPCRRVGALQALAASTPGVRLVVLDMTDAAAIDRAHDQITAEPGRAGLTCWATPPGSSSSARWSPSPTSRPGQC
jgi:hypothetical protein